MKKFRFKDLFTIPNILGYFRLICIPVFCYLYLTANSKLDYLISGIVVAVASITDLFDGFIARKFNQVTDLGKILDPIADKLTHGALAICLAITHPLMWALIILMAIKEGFMAIAGLYFIKKSQEVNGAKWYGKVCTALLFIGLLILFVFPGLKELYVNLIILFLMALMLFSLIMYIIYYVNFNKELEREKQE